MFYNIIHGCIGIKNNISYKDVIKFIFAYFTMHGDTHRGDKFIYTFTMRGDMYRGDKFIYTYFSQCVETSIVALEGFRQDVCLHAS